MREAAASAHKRDHSTLYRSPCDTIFTAVYQRKRNCSCSAGVLHFRTLECCCAQARHSLCFRRADKQRFILKLQHEQTPLACVLVDEAQFLAREQVDELAQVVDELNVPVLCFGIRTDFQGELFPGSTRLLAIADKLSELKTVCTCGRKATMTVRVNEAGEAIASGAQVEIGGNDRYESKCRRHHRQVMASAQ